MNKLKKFVISILRYLLPDSNNKQNKEACDIHSRDDNLPVSDKDNCSEEGEMVAFVKRCSDLKGNSDDSNQMIYSVIWHIRSYPVVLHRDNDRGYPGIFESVVNMCAERVEWDSKKGPHIDEKITSIGWFYAVEDSGIRAFNVYAGDKNYYIAAFGTLEWFGASYNPRPQPHMTCGIWKIDSDRFESIESAVNKSKYRK